MRAASEQDQRRPADAMTAFMRLWLALMLPYILVTFVFDLVVRGWIDLDWVMSPWPYLFPLAQAALFKWLARRWRAG